MQLKCKEKAFKHGKACREAKEKGIAARRPTKSETAVEKREADSLSFLIEGQFAEHTIMGYRLLSADCLLAACSKKLEWKDAEIARLTRLLRRHTQLTHANGST
eukprot:3055835-Prymnesium_polylepis.1